MASPRTRIDEALEQAIEEHAALREGENYPPNVYVAFNANAKRAGVVLSELEIVTNMLMHPGLIAWAASGGAEVSQRRQDRLLSLVGVLLMDERRQLPFSILERMEAYLVYPPYWLAPELATRRRANAAAAAAPLSSTRAGTRARLEQLAEQAQPATTLADANAQLAILQATMRRYAADLDEDAQETSNAPRQNE